MINNIKTSLTKNNFKLLTFLVSVLFLVSTLSLISAADTTPPAVGIYLSQDNNGQHNPSSYKMTIYANLYNLDSQSSISECLINWNDGAGWESVSKGTEGTWYSVNHTYSSLGSKTVEYKCKNRYGYWSNNNSKHAKFDTIEILALSPATGIFLSQDLSGFHNTLSYSYTISANLFNNDTFYTIEQCLINWNDGAGWESVSKGTEGTWYSVNHTYSSLGSKTVEYKCKNSQGTWSNISSSQHIDFDLINIQISDTTAPAITIVSPINGVYNITSIPINIVVSDVNLDAIWFNWNGTNTTYNTSIIFTFPDNSIINLKVYANDTSGNLAYKNITFKINTSESNGTSIDTTAPILSNITSNPNMSFVNNGSSQNLIINFSSDEYPINLTFNIYNSNSNIVSTRFFYLANESYLPVTFVIPSNLSNGVYTLNLTVSDRFGNSRTYNLGRFTVNKSSSEEEEEDDGAQDEETDYISNRNIYRTSSPSTASNNVINLNKAPEKKWSYNFLLLLLIILILFLIALIILVYIAKFI
jgi:hypothetical protein